MRIGLIAENTGVSRDTIRLYENMGLLIGITRPHKYNNYKEYSEENIERINFIRLMKTLGFSLKECKEVIVSMQENKFNNDIQEAVLNDKITEIDKKIEELISLRDLLEKYRKIGCDNVEIIDKIRDQASHE